MEKPPTDDGAVAIVTAVAGTSKAVALLTNSSDELPYPPEKYPGKLCVLCNLGERSQLGQGIVLKIQVNDEPMDVTRERSENIASATEANSSFEDSDSTVVLSHKRQKNGNKLKSLSSTTEYVDELEKIGHTEAMQLKSLLDDDGYYYIHRSCASWTFDVTRNADGTFTGLQTAIAQSLNSKCAFCSRYGASLNCKMTCANAYHFPCMTASGGFQMIQSYTCFCRDHMGEVPNACPDAEDIKCRTCSWSGDISNLMLCCKCGDHYHGTCVGIAQAPGVRAGWQCSRCRQCHICRSDLPQGITDSRTVSCEHCDKIYHTQCVRPVMATVPKYGWKCRCCRVCVDCGSRSPGAGASSRWHQHYTVCDSCYQQRNKGFSCPVCRRAYRAMAQREMVKCSLCQKHVHSTCDAEADLLAYQTKKEANPDYEYMCAPCKVQVQTGRFVPSALRRMTSIDEDGMTLQESLYAEQADEVVPEKLLLKLKSDFGLGKGKPLLASKSAKKKFGLSLSRAKGKVGVLKRSRFVDMGRKRGPKAKMRGLFGVPGLGLQRPTSDKDSSKDDEPGVENRLVLCSAKDKFVLTQDICVMCGAVGTDQEGCLISCSQCGQCYHPYCVTVKVTKVILQKGWRCLDCTVCEGCGQRHDEARLLLCDDCDVSYHIYCMDPPLEIVPQGNWKCRWCAVCQKCGANEPGTNCAWMNSYTECGPCASQSNCSLCCEAYSDGELILQCLNCNRWLHGACDAVATEEDAEKCFDEGYHCMQCRPRDVLPPHLKPKITQPELQMVMASAGSAIKSPDCLDTVALTYSLEGMHYLDGICLSQHGLHQIKSLQLDSVRKKRRQKVNEPPEKDAAILAAIESVVAGGSMDNSLEDFKMDALDPAEIYKDGMVWDRENSSPPEGFTLCTTEQGTVVLRKKRQRNLQKVGIGGFTVRNRTMKSLKDTLVKDELDETGQVPQITAGLEDKKKKIVKKKMKNKLIETYPSYLQEAFFGKELLGAKMNFDADLSDDESKKSQESCSAELGIGGGVSVVGGQDTNNKLSVEELKMIESIRAKQNQLEEQKLKKFGQQPSSGSLVKTNAPMSDAQGGVQVLLQQSSGAVMPSNAGRPNQVVKVAPPPMNVDSVDANVPNRVPVTAAGMPQHSIKSEVISSSSGMDANITDLLDTIINDDNDLLVSMDDIINGVFTDESQESQESLSMQSNSSTSFQPSQIPKGNIPPSSGQIVQGMTQQQQPQLPSGISVPQRAIPSGPAQQQQQQQQQPRPSMQQQQQAHMGPFDQQARTLAMGVQPQPHPTINRVLSMPHGQQQMGSMPQTPPMGMDPMIPGGQWNPMTTAMETDMTMTGDDMANQSSGPQTNNQKASERMRLDEMLGEMATSAPVLYANTHHPELKVEFPNWSDRHKQIIKRWRGLTVDIKTPFNQKARENRTTLRMKKTQQISAQSSPKDSFTTAASSPSSSSSVSSSAIVPTTVQPMRQISHVQLQQMVSVGQQQQQQQQQQLQQVQQAGCKNFTNEIQQPQQQNLNELMLVGGVSPQQQQHPTIHMQSPFQPSQHKQSEVLGQVKNASERPLSPLTFDCEDALPSNTAVSSPKFEKEQCTVTFERSPVLANIAVSPPSSFSISTRITNKNNSNTIPNTSFTTNATLDTLFATSNHLCSVRSAGTVDQSDKNEIAGSPPSNSSARTQNSHSSPSSVATTESLEVSRSVAVSSSKTKPQRPADGAILPNSQIERTQIAIDAALTVDHDRNNSSKGTGATVETKNEAVNFLVSHPISPFMKTLTVGSTSRQAGNTMQQQQQQASQFVIHQPAPHYHPLSHSGPAPNVTVNPNGNFQTNPNATIRAAYTPFRTFNSQFHALNSFGRLTGTMATPQPPGVQSPILAAQLQTINQIASAQMQAQAPVLQIQGNSVEPMRKNVLPIYVSTTIAQPQSTKRMAPSPSSTTAVVIVPQSAVTSKVILPEDRLSPMSSSTISPISASPSPTMTKTICSTESSTPSPQSSTSSMIYAALTPPQPDQNIRVLTPSEIMRTLPSIPIQDAVFMDRMCNNTGGDNVDGGPQRPQGYNYNQTHAEAASSAMDQEKMTAQQKSLRDQENERQWKLLQAARAREQQMQQQMVVQDSNQPPHDQAIMGLQSPTGFLPPTLNIKGRPVNFQQTGMVRPVSVQIPRQRMGQNPFSPQSQSSQSPMEQYPSSPAQSIMDMVTHSPSEQMQDSLTQSPHTPRSFDMQSPNSGLSRSPAYAGGVNVPVPMGSNQYAMPPGTPRPGPSTNQSRPTVYTRDMLGGPFAQFAQDHYNNTNNSQQPMASQNTNITQPHDGNRQLRDLLQRQQHSAPSSPSITSTPQSPSNWSIDGTPDNQSQMQQQQQPQQHQQSQMVMQGMGDNTFRLPLPPGVGARPQRMQLANQNMMRGPNPMANASRPVQADIRQRMVRPKNIQNQMPSQQQFGQQQQTPNNPIAGNQFNTMRMQGGMLVNNQGVPNSPMMQQHNMSHGRQLAVNQEQMVTGHDQSNTELQEVAMIAEKLESLQHNIGGNPTSGVGEHQRESDNPEIPDNVTADLETLENEVDGEDLFDEALLLSGDFNILEYADPELGTMNDEDQLNLLVSLETTLDEKEKEETTKKQVDMNQFVSNVAPGSTGNQPVNQMISSMGAGNQQSIGLNVGTSKSSGDQLEQTEMVHFQHSQGQQQQQQQQPQQQRVFQMKQPVQHPPNIQQIQQQMINQIQQNAAMGKIIAPGTQFTSNGVIGIVTANNQIQFSYSGVQRQPNPNQHRMQQMRMAGPNCPIQPVQMGQPRMAMAQANRMAINVGHEQINQQNQSQSPQIQGKQQQQQQHGQPPPPPYPIPPPPYPGNSGPGSGHNQEQPLLLEDLLEQEKREQERQQMNSAGGDATQQNIDQSFQRTNMIEGGFQGNVQNMGLGQMNVQPPVVGAPGQMMGQPRPQMVARGTNQTQWRMPPNVAPVQQQITEPRRDIPVFPLQPAPPVPPENLMSDKDRQMHVAYDQWLSQQNIVLGDQLKYFETEVGKLRKAKKFLNTKQRQAKKTGGELSEADAAELLKVSTEQSIIQKQLESARKQARQHNVLLQDYRTKRNIANPGSSPATAPQSPLMSPSPLMQQSVQSPLNNPMIQAAQSPLHSPSPMMTQSPGSSNMNSILQSPNNQGNAMSPYNTMQSSPRIGTPQMEENPFSPGAVGPSPSPSLSARLTSPSPRMTSPQHRPQFASNRVLSSPGGLQFQQQQQTNNQQMIISLGNGQRFARPQPTEGIRQRIVINSGQQQVQQQQMFISGQQQPQHGHMQDQVMLQSPQNTQQLGQQMPQNSPLPLGPQRALIQQRQQILQHHILNQQPSGQGAQAVQQYQKQSPIQSPIHQPQSPMINQMAPVSPIHSQASVQYGNMQSLRIGPGGSQVQQQQQQQQQHQANMNMMDSNQRNIYLQQQTIQNHQINQEVDNNHQNISGGGGGIVGPHNPIPLPPSFFKYGYIKMGLFGGAPILPFGRGAKRMPNPGLGQPSDSKNAAPPVTANPKVTIVKRVRPSGQAPGLNVAIAASSKPKGEVVVIDSSPDDKQRIIDYDDDNDKAVVQEVSLSAAAAQLDDASVIETFSTGEFVASPLEPEVTEEYELFGQYEEFVDSDDDIKGLKNALKPADNGLSVGPSSTEELTEYVTMGQDFIIETSEGKRPPCSVALPDNVIEPECIQNETVATAASTSGYTGTSLTPVNIMPKVGYPVRVSAAATSGASTSTAITTRPAPGVVHNKLVKDGQTTAIVSIGNTTISVPVLKTVPMSHSKTGPEQQNPATTMANKKILMKTPINLKFNVKNVKNTLVSLSPVMISNATGKRVMQASIIRSTTPQHTVTISPPTTSMAVPPAGDDFATTTTVLEKLSTIIKSPSMSYSKVSSLTVSQSALPEKIFQDDVSPDSSVEHDDQDLMPVGEKMEHGPTSDATAIMARTTSNSPEVENPNGGGVDGDKKSKIPYTVIMKQTKDSNITLSVPHGTTQRLMSVMPQLSPLSQPSEMNTNMQNASQQLRTIMSSLNTAGTAQQQMKMETQMAQKSVADAGGVMIEKRAPVTGKSFTKVHKSTNVQLISKGTTFNKNLDASKLTQILHAQGGSGSPTPTGSILVVKQVRSGQRTTISTMKQHLVKSIKTDTEGSSPAVPNLTKIQQNLQKEGNKAVIQFNSIPPPALVITSSRSAVITASNSVTAAATTSESTVTLTAASDGGIPKNKVAPPFSGSILSATLSKPNVKMVPVGTGQKTAGVLLHSQLTSPPFRRSKSTDEPPLFLRESPAPIHGTKRLSLELSTVKTESGDNGEADGVVTSSTTAGYGLTFNGGNIAGGGCKSSSVTSSVPKSEDSQHVLLKQLLQNSSSPSGGSVTTPPTISSRTVPGLRAPSLGLVSSLEQQLSRPAIPPAPASQLMNCSPPTTSNVTTSTSITATVVTTTPTQCAPVEAPKLQSVLSKETSFLSKPGPVTEQKTEPALDGPKTEMEKSQATTPVSVAPIPPPKTPSEPPPPYHLATMNTVPPPNVVNKNEMSSLPLEVVQNPLGQPKVQLQPFLGAPIPQSSQAVYAQVTQQQHVAPQQLPYQIQAPTPQYSQMLISPPITTQNPLMSPLLSQNSQNSQNSNDIKKELIDDSSQQSAASDQSKSESSKNEFMDTSTESCMDAMKVQMESAADIKKRKRREYQQNRRQMKANPKESNYGKKKQKRLAKFEEDYDTFIDGMMIQLRQLPPMQIVEPDLCRNFGICNPLGAGDLTKLNSVKNYSIAMGDLIGDYGAAELESDCDFYNTMPFGEKSSVKGISSTTHYGFYDQEFSQLWFDVEDELKSRYELTTNRERDIGTPDTVISSSSPECMAFEPISGDFPGLKFIDEYDEETHFSSKRPFSPKVPIVMPVPIRLRGLEHNENRSLQIVDSNKENEYSMDKNTDGRGGKYENDNLTVTLTLSSSAAEDIIGVLRDLANILHIPSPTQYDIVERISTPPSRKLGMYRAKGRDGNTIGPVDIQVILNGPVKFCSNCDIVILSAAIRANSSDLSMIGLGEQTRVAEVSDPFRTPEELHFCSRVCHKQYQWRPTGADGERNKGDHESDGQMSTGSIRKSLDMDLNDEDLKMEVDLDESELKAVAGGIDLKDLGEIKSQVEDDDLDEDMEEFTISRSGRKQGRKCELDSDVEMEPPLKQHKGLQYKYFSANCFNVSPSKYRKPTDKEITETLFRMNITVTAGPRIPEDTRKCIFCHQTGDGVADGPSRLLNFDVDKWVHLNCALWSEGVYETVNGALMNLEGALQSSLTQTCIICSQMGATIKCFKPRCTNLYHLSCAMKDQCVFYKNKTTMCCSHAPKTEKDNELTTLSVQRRVYVDRDESRQVASVMHHSELSNLLRVGSLIFLNVGQLLPHQLQAFHTPNHIYPIGYKIIRFYWSMREPNKRSRYICSIADVSGRPEFRVTVQEPNKDDIELRDSSPRAVWQRILEPLAEMRRDQKIIQLFPKYVTGEDLFGLTEPAVVRILESLPGIETLPDYRFKYGRNPLLELPLAINPSGAARTEPKLKQNVSWKKPHTQRTGSSQRPVFVPTSTIAGEVACPYSKQFVHSKSSQYKKMKQEWRNNVFLARSKISGLGLYAARDLEKHTMVIEYIGEVIRTEVSEFREKQYEAKNRGIYMFRLDEDRVVDATLSGGLARYINHSCNPNCVTEIVEVDREFRIIIFAKRRINRGEELSYDYKFDIEDDNHKISCMCGAPNCKKWMN